VKNESIESTRLSWEAQRKDPEKIRNGEVFFPEEMFLVLRRLGGSLT